MTTEERLDRIEYCLARFLWLGRFSVAPSVAALIHMFVRDGMWITPPTDGDSDVYQLR
jgi:hypothetical protein